MTAAILVLNSGSSSIKFALYPAEGTEGESSALYHGEISGIGDIARLNARNAKGETVADMAVIGLATHHAALSTLLNWISQAFRWNRARPLPVIVWSMAASNSPNRFG